MRRSRKSRKSLRSFPGEPRDYAAETARGDALRAAGQAQPLCWLPQPQLKQILGDLPGKREDGRLWFE